MQNRPQKVSETANWRPQEPNSDVLTLSVSIRVLATSARNPLPPVPYCNLLRWQGQRLNLTNWMQSPKPQNPYKMLSFIDLKLKQLNELFVLPDFLTDDWLEKTKD